MFNICQPKDRINLATFTNNFKWLSFTHQTIIILVHHLDPYLVLTEKYVYMFLFTDRVRGNHGSRLPGRHRHRRRPSLEREL